MKFKMIKLAISDKEIEECYPTMKELRPNLFAQ